MNNLDFLNLNSLRNYPIKDGLSRVSTDGLFTIPNDLIVDLSISAPNNDNLSLYISKIVNTAISVNIEITADGIGPIGNFNIAVAEASTYQDAELSPATAFDGALGVLTVGTLDTITTLPSGEFTFDKASTELLMRVYTPATQGVNYIAFTDSKGNQVHKTGYVNILAESNVQFRSGGDAATVIVDAGENLGLNKQCDGNLIPIKSINGIAPDADGNFYVIPNGCIAIDQAEFGIVLKDTCGKPCLGCDEVGTLTNRLVTVESDLFKLRDYVNNLQALITQLTTIVNYQCERE